MNFISINEKKINEINGKYAELKVVSKHNIEVIGGGGVVIDHMGVCNITELKTLIKELTDLYKAVEDATGLC